MLDFNVANARPLLDSSFLSQLHQPFLAGYNAVMDSGNLGRWAMIFIGSVLLFAVMVLLFRFTFGRFK